MTAWSDEWCLYYMWRDTDGWNAMVVLEDGGVMHANHESPIKAEDMHKLKRFASKYEAYMWRNFRMFSDDEVDRVDDDMCDLRATTMTNMRAWLNSMWNEKVEEKTNEE
jgi:hypothetical protein